MNHRRRIQDFSVQAQLRRLGRATTLLLLVILAARPAAAQESVSETRALAHLEAGNRKFDARDFDGALVEYRAAHAIFPRGSLLFNIGIAEGQRGRLLEAAEAFEGALARPDTTPEVATQAREQLGRVGGKLSVLEVKADRAAGGGAFALDGTTRGTLPLARPVRLLPGVHTLRATKDGYRPFERTISLAAGGQASVAIALDPEPAPPPRSSNRRFWLWGTVGAVVVAAAATAVIVVATRGSTFPPCPSGEKCADFRR